MDDDNIITDVCHCYHLQLLSKKIVQWVDIAYYLGLTKADVQEIERDSNTYALQKFHMLQRWKSKESANATYEVLHNCFIKHEMDSLADDLLNIMKQRVQPVVSAIIKRYKGKLIKQYKKIFQLVKLITGPQSHQKQFTSI